MSYRESLSKHSPVASLASLEYLQNQRRGSITDPSLHAAHVSSGVKLGSTYRHHLDNSSTSSGHSSLPMDQSSRRELPDSGPDSPFVFGNATPRATEHASQLRKILHSPTSDQQSSHRLTPLSHDSPDSIRTHSGLPYYLFMSCIQADAY